MYTHVNPLLHVAGIGYDVVRSLYCCYSAVTRHLLGISFKCNNYSFSNYSLIVNCVVHGFVNTLVLVCKLASVHI